MKAIKFYTVGTGASKKVLETLNLNNLFNQHPRTFAEIEGDDYLYIISETTLKPAYQIPHLHISNLANSEFGIVNPILYLNKNKIEKNINIKMLLENNSITNNKILEKQKEIYQKFETKELILRNAIIYNKFLNYKNINQHIQMQNRLKIFKNFKDYQTKNFFTKNLIISKNLIFQQIKIKKAAEYHKKWSEFYSQIFNIKNLDQTELELYESVIKFEKLMINHADEIDEIREQEILENSPNIENNAEYIDMNNFLETKNDQKSNVILNKYHSNLAYFENNEVKFINITNN